MSSWAWSEGSGPSFAFAAANSSSIDRYAASALSIFVLASMRTCSVRSFAASSSARNTASSCCNSSDLFACALAESNAAAVIAPLSSSFRSNVAFDSATSASSASTRSCSSSALAACAADASALASSLVRASSSLALSWSRSEATSSSVFRRRFLCVATARSSASRSLTPSAIRLCAAASSSLRPFSLSLNFLTRPAETFSFFLNFSSSLESPPPPRCPGRGISRPLRRSLWRARARPRGP